jgi:hypothetical protein
MVGCRPNSSQLTASRLDLHPQLRGLLLGAYGPCPAFKGPCCEMRWAPSGGHVPRGFCGATGKLTEIELVLVCAEPGDPYGRENHGGEPTPDAYLASAYSYAYKCFRDGTDLFHRNIRRIIDLCWPGESFDDQLRKVWLVDSVLCSASVESGPVSLAAERECRARYLERQIALFPDALVVALGSKAYRRLRGVPGILKAFAAAPPGSNRKEAMPSWREIARRVQAGAT